MCIYCFLHNWCGDKELVLEVDVAWGRDGAFTVRKVVCMYGSCRCGEDIN